MPGYLAATCWLKPLVRSVATLLPEVPCSTATLPWPFSAAPRSSAAILAWPRKLEPMNPMKSLHAVPLTVRSMVSTGMCLALACANAGASPSEFSGATISTCAPWAIMSWMSVFCWETLALALRWIRLMPSFLASSVIDWVSVARNGLLVDSDWENPTTALARSSRGAPYWAKPHGAPLEPPSATCCWPAPAPAGAGGAVLSTLLAHPAASSAAAAANPITAVNRALRWLAETIRASTPSAVVRKKHRPPRGCTAATDVVAAHRGDAQNDRWRSAGSKRMRTVANVLHR